MTWTLQLLVFYPSAGNSRRRRALFQHGHSDLQLLQCFSQGLHHCQTQVQMQKLTNCVSTKNTDLSHCKQTFVQSLVLNFQALHTCNQLLISGM